MTPQRAKEVGIIVSVLLHSALLFSLTSLFVSQHRATALPVLIFLGLLALLWVALVAVALAVLRQPGSSAWVTIGIGVALAGAGLMHVPAITAGVVLIIFLALARRSIYREVNNRVLFRISETFSPGLQSILFGVGAAALGLAWPLVEGSLSGTQLLLSPETVGVVVNRLVPALPSHLTAFIDIGQLTSLVTASLNQILQSLLASYYWAFLLIILLIAISTWRAVMPLVGWVALPLIAVLIYLARQANLVYLTRSQATIERLHL